MLFGYETSVPCNAMSGQAEEHAQQFERCPECGWDTSQRRSVMPASLKKARRWVIAAIVLAAAIAMMIAAATTKSFHYSLGTPVPRLLDPPVILTEVQRIAGGGAPGGHELTRRLLSVIEPINPHLPGSRSVEVGFVRPNTERLEYTTFGWPSVWVSRSITSIWDDAVAQTGFKPAVTDAKARPIGQYEAPEDPLRIYPGPRWRWEGAALRLQMQPEETGGRYTIYHIHALGLLAAVVLVLLIAAAIEWARRRWGKRRLRTVRTRFWLVTALLTLAFAGAGLAGSKRFLRFNVFPKLKQVVLPPAPVYYTRDGFARLPLSADDAERLLGHEDGDRQLAAAVLAAAPKEAGPAESLYLAATYDNECAVNESTTINLFGAFHLASVGYESYVRRGDFGTVEPMAPRRVLTVDTANGQLSAWWSGRGPGARSYWVRLQAETLAIALGAFVVVIMLVSLGFRAALAVRHRRGLCPQCRYRIERGPS